MSTDRPQFVLTFEEMPGGDQAVELRIRALLKFAGRGLCLRCVRYQVFEPDAAATPACAAGSGVPDQPQAAEAHQPAKTARPRQRRKKQLRQAELFPAAPAAPKGNP